MASLCSTPLNELVMVEAITPWTLSLEEAEISLDVVRVRWERKTEKEEEAQ